MILLFQYEIKTTPLLVFYIFMDLPGKHNSDFQIFLEYNEFWTICYM